MPAVYASPPTLTLVPSNPWPTSPHTYPKEHQINQEIFLGIAPDREALLTSRKTLDELRQTLKIHVGLTESHWLYRNRKRANASLRDGNTRISTLIRGGPVTTHEVHSPSQKEIHILRHVLSASALADSSTRLEGRYLSPVREQDVDIWGTVMLSTTEKLISPRPLGPTHILIVHSIPGPSRIYQPVKGGGRKPLRRKKSSPLSNVMEIPINDLLFVLSVPNLAPVAPILPPRLHKELPQVLMYAPHIETFPELVVYLHTLNQAELFRKMVPEWIRDLMHPLPELTVPTITSPPADHKTIAKAPLHLLSLLIPAAGTEKFSMARYEPHPREFQRTIKFVADEIARAAHAFSSNEKDDMDPILCSVAQLNALRDNLEYIGYFGRDLWHELDVYREVLVQAVSYRAKTLREAGLED